MIKALPLRRTFFRQWREWRGLTTAEIAEQTGVTETVVLAVESGRLPYSNFFLTGFARAVGADAASVLNRPPQPEQRQA